MVNLFLATGNFGREGAGCMMITGQGNGQGGREHGQKCDQLPGARSITDPEARRYIAGVWGIDETELPGPGYPRCRNHEGDPRGRDQSVVLDVFQPRGVAAGCERSPRSAGRSSNSSAVIDFFMSETAQYADVIFAGSLQEEDEGIICSGEGRVQKINKAVDPPGDAKSDALIICDLARKLGRGEYFQFDSTREIYRGIARGVARRNRRLLRHHLGTHRTGTRRVLAVPFARPSRYSAPV